MKQTPFSEKVSSFEEQTDKPIKNAEKMDTHSLVETNIRMRGDDKIIEYFRCIKVVSHLICCN